MDICVVGTGYVGLVAGACLADLGHRVTCVDHDQGKIAALERGESVIFEPGLDEVIVRNRAAGRLHWTSDLAGATRRARLVFVAVGTPPLADGRADVTGVLEAVRELGPHLSRPCLVVIKSTVPVGTAAQVREILWEVARVPFDVVSNPEFLAEGTAVTDFTRPDRIVLGYTEPSSGEVMERLYAPLVRTGRPILHMDNASAELAKYAANAMLATRVSFMNELAGVCEALGADIERIRRVIGADTRIGSRFLFAGAGYGGSCFPKDLQALVRMGEDHGEPMALVRAVESVNERQKGKLFAKVAAALGGRLDGARVAVWGVAFKPGTDDIRHAPAIVAIEALLESGAVVHAYDPKAVPSARARLGDRVLWASSAFEALDGADVLVIATEWAEFRGPDLSEMARRMRGRIVVDGRNLYEPDDLSQAGFIYLSIGRPPAFGV